MTLTTIPARKPFIVGNWKLNNGLAASLALVTELKNALGPATRDVDVGVAPVFTALASVAKRLEGSGIAVFGQDCYWEAKGAFTGEVSAELLRDAGATGVIIGHSERRQHFGETDKHVNLKVRAALRAGLQPIVCVGETESERDSGRTMERVLGQLDGALAGLSSDEVGRITLAYEPVWAIGTGRTATPGQAQEVHAALRGRLREHAAGVAESVRIQYGGSVKAENAATLLGEKDIDGALVGGASLDARSFIDIVRFKRS
jgi:triosephosphate isomerase